MTDENKDVQEEPAATPVVFMTEHFTWSPDEGMVNTTTKVKAREELDKNASPDNVDVGSVIGISDRIKEELETDNAN